MAKNFHRGLDEKSFEKIKEFFESKLGKEIKRARFDGQPAFNICIRDNYINIYWQGCSVLKYSPNARKRNFLIHYKYVYKKNYGDNDNTYRSLTPEGDDLVDEKTSWSFRDNIVIPASKGEIEAVKKYVIGEKEKLSCYLVTVPPFLVDLEIAFPRKSEEKGKNVADRIDMARLVYKDGVPTLQLVEVKIDNDSRLRSTFNKKRIEENPPEIMTQMRYYQEFLNNEKHCIKASYKKIAKNYIDLGLTDQMSDLKGRKAEKVLTDFHNRGKIDPRPYILIIGKKSNMKGRVGNHLERLQKLFKKAKYPDPELVLPKQCEDK